MSILLAMGSAITMAHTDHIVILFAEFLNTGVPAKGFSVDLADAAAVREAIALAERELGPIHLLFWNAAAWPLGIFDATPEDMTKALNTSVTGT
jgi:NAD(P)-dependent dehydrogenase (short-subunit alcohol dehydrogenase family)